MDVEGAAAEMAVAKYFGVYWYPSVNSGKAADVKNFQVRSTNHKNGKLIVRENDEKNEQYILVTCNVQKFNIIGWIWLNDAKQDRYTKMSYLT